MSELNDILKRLEAELRLMTVNEVKTILVDVIQRLEVELEELKQKKVAEMRSSAEMSRYLGEIQGYKKAIAITEERLRRYYSEQIRGGQGIQ